MANKKKDESLKSHIHVLEEIKRIPKQLRKIFLPSTEKGFARYLANIIAWKLGSKDRHVAYDLWRRYKDFLPDAARKWPLRKIKTAIKIIELRKRKYKDGDQPNDKERN